MRSGPGLSTGTSLPELLADPAGRKERAAERVCDRAAEQLNELAIGLPAYHPLLKESGPRLQALRDRFDRFRDRFRPATPQEMEALGVVDWHPTYLPDPGRRVRPATAEDLNAGRAIFFLRGTAKRVDLKLPATGVLRKEAKKAPPPRVLIVQAEAGADGAVTYGVIGRHEVRAVPASELADVKPLEAPGGGPGRGEGRGP